MKIEVRDGRVFAVEGAEKVEGKKTFSGTQMEVQAPKGEALVMLNLPPSCNCTIEIVVRPIVQLVERPKTMDEILAGGPFDPVSLGLNGHLDPKPIPGSLPEGEGMSDLTEIHRRKQEEEKVVSVSGRRTRGYPDL